MNKTKTNSHFLPMEKLFLLFTFSSPLPSQLQCGRDGIAEDGGGSTAAASTRQGEQGQLGGGPAQSRGWQRGEAARGTCVHPYASYSNPQQLPAALHRDLTTRFQMSPPPTAVIQLPPPNPLLTEGREAERGHKQGLTSPMLAQHPAAAQAMGASEGLVGCCQGSPPSPG